MTTTKIAIQGVNALTPQGWLKDATVLIEDGEFTSINQSITPPGFHLVNAQGLQMLPGIIDLHGDAFERMICPRPGVNFPLPIAIAEFPADVDIAAKSQAYGAAVLMGAPNLVRGGSHLGLMSVAQAVEHDVLDCLCSDYHYPSLFYAPFKLQELGLMSFEQAWKLVSDRPARAAKISDRKGKIALGLDADFLLISPDNPLPSSISSVYILGKEVARYQTK